MNREQTQLIQEYARAQTAAVRMARSERMAQLRGHHYRGWDDRGVHSFSWQAGYAAGLANAINLLGLAEVDPDFYMPFDLRRSGHREAVAELIRELEEEGAGVDGLRRLMPPESDQPKEE